MNAPATDWSNARLVEGCLAGDDRAWRILVDRYKDLVYSVPLRYGAPHQDAADIFQAVWLDLFNEMPRLREADALPTWLVRVAANKCYHWKREQGPGEDAPVEEAADAGAGAVWPAEFADLEREQALRNALTELSPRCRKMVELLFFEDPPLRYADVAERLGLAQGSIGFIRARCLRKLRDALEKRGF